MNAALILAGCVCLGAWGWMWHPAAPLSAGLAFLWLAAVRASNKRKAVSSERR